MRRSLITLGALTAAAAIVSAPVALPATMATALAAPPTSVATEAAASIATEAAGARIALDGTENTRTLAGFRTTDGSVVRPHRALRSDDLAGLSPADLTRLQNERLAVVVDLRTGLERALSADAAIPGTRAEWFDVLGGLPPTALIDLSSSYRAFVTDPGARRAFGATLHTIEATAADGRAVLYHCSAGKDRTGWTTAVLLTILGVDRATVEADFLASNAYRHTTPADPLNGVNIDWLRAAFAAADETYGSFDNYVRDGLDLTAADITSLRTELLEPASGGK
jgi:protein-tyrosine phosphatase